MSVNTTPATAEGAAASAAASRLRHVLIGDGESPHLLKWARALAPQVDLWALSTRSFTPAWDALVPPEKRLALQTQDVPPVAGLPVLSQPA